MERLTGIGPIAVCIRLKEADETHNSVPRHHVESGRLPSSPTNPPRTFYGLKSHQCRGLLLQRLAGGNTWYGVVMVLERLAKYELAFYIRKETRVRIQATPELCFSSTAHQDHSTIHDQCLPTPMPEGPIEQLGSTHLRSVKS